MTKPPALTTFEEFHLWDNEQCQQVINIAQKGEAHEARVIAQGAERKPDIRSTERYKVEDLGVLNQLLNAFGEHIKSLGIAFSDSPTESSTGSVFAFVDAPEGYEIEVIQRP